MSKEKQLGIYESEFLNDCIGSCDEEGNDIFGVAKGSTQKSVEELLKDYNIEIKPENRHIFPPINIKIPE